MEPKLTTTKNEIIEAIMNHNFSQDNNKAKLKSIKKISSDDILIELVNAKLNIGYILTNATCKGSKNKKQDFIVTLSLDSHTDDMVFLVNGNNVAAYAYATNNGYLDEVKNNEYPYLFDNIDKIGEKNAKETFTKYYNKIGLELKNMIINNISFKEKESQVTAYAWSIKIRNVLSKDNFIEIGYIIPDKNEEFGERIYIL